MCYVSVQCFSEKVRKEWGDDVLVIPVYCFAIRTLSKEIKLSDEHTEFKWLSYNHAQVELHFDIDKTALWELNEKLMKSWDLVRDNFSCK